jgi:hypothetical protein
MAKLLKSRWLWYSLAALGLFVLAGYCSNYVTALHNPVSPWGFVSPYPWDQYDTSIPWIATRKYVVRHIYEHPLIASECNLCLFGKLIRLSYSETPPAGGD